MIFFVAVWNAWRTLRDQGNTAPAAFLQSKQSQSRAAFLPLCPPAHTATRERQGQSLAQAWRDTPHVWNFRHQCLKPLSRFTSVSCFETQHSTVDVWEVLTSQALNNSSGGSSSEVHRPDCDEMLLRFLFDFLSCFFFFFLNAQLWLKSVACLLVCHIRGRF